MNPIREQIDLLTRRHFFGRTGLSLGTRGALDLAAQNAQSAMAQGQATERAPAVCPGCLISRRRPGGRFTFT